MVGGEVDYLLYAEGTAIGVVEAKPEGHTLRGVVVQSAGSQSRTSCLRPVPRWRPVATGPVRPDCRRRLSRGR
jgi:hypothetical protein